MSRRDIIATILVASLTATLVSVGFIGWRQHRQAAVFSADTDVLANPDFFGAQKR